MKHSWLDKKIDLILDFTADTIPKEMEIKLLFRDAAEYFDHAREIRNFSEKKFVERSKKLLVVFSRMKSFVTGKDQHDLQAIEDFLLTAVTTKK